mmetsp:Transcript_6300/g.7937  ORF Transcript_6300/g.7937 Transcript_6300/m.7937 type:complete len:472 (-) Transcript_6300:426-1841(-)
MESTPAQAAEGTAIVRVLAAVLERLVGANTHLARADPGQVTKFHALKAPRISVLQYLERIHKYASCSSECFILALIYIDRLIQRNNFLLTELNVHRVVITSILLAAKFFDDAYYNNAYYAKVGGVLVSEMNSLEVEFLFRLNFSLRVSPDLYSKYHAELVSHAIGTPAMNGFMSMGLNNAPVIQSGVFVKNNSVAPQLTSNPFTGDATGALTKPVIATLQSSSPCQTSHTSEYHQQRPLLDTMYIAAEMPSQITPSPPQTASAAPPLAPYTVAMMQQQNYANNPHVNGRNDISQNVIQNQFAVEYEQRQAIAASTKMLSGFETSRIQNDPDCDLRPALSHAYQDDTIRRPSAPHDFHVPEIQNIYQVAPVNNMAMVNCLAAAAAVDYSVNLRQHQNNASHFGNTVVDQQYYVSMLPHEHGGNHISSRSSHHNTLSHGYGTQPCQTGVAANHQPHYSCHAQHPGVVAGCSGI